VLPGSAEDIMADAGIKAAKMDSRAEGRMAKLKKKVLGGVEDSWRTERATVTEKEVAEEAEKARIGKVRRDMGM
jgi:hypothetical protein